VRSYRVEFLLCARDELAALDRTVAKRVFAKLAWLAENFELVAREPLGGGLAGLFKLRVGSYRAIYSYDEAEKLITVHMIGHRADIYRQ